MKTACAKPSAESLEAKPRGYLAILDHFQRLVKLDLERRTARVESAIPLPDELKSKVQAGLTRLYGPGLEISFKREPGVDWAGCESKSAAMFMTAACRRGWRSLAESF